MIGYFFLNEEEIGDYDYDDVAGAGAADCVGDEWMKANDWTASRTSKKKAKWTMMW